MSDTFLAPLTVVAAGASLAFSAVFYHLHQQKKTEIQKLKEIPSFQADKHLSKILNASLDKRLHYVAVEGVVQAVGEPLSSQRAPRCYGVIQKITMVDHWKIWNSTLRLWVSRKQNARTERNSVPFRLVQPGTYLGGVHVQVESPLEACGDFLEEVQRSVRRADDGLVEVVVQGLSGERLVATEEREEMLRVGSVLTGFGEVLLEREDVIRLRPPRDGRAYLLVPGDYRSLVQRHENSASMWKGLTALCGITGTTLLATFVYSAVSKDSRRN
ncbi:mitochondrial ubiquitin ligase activator of nfkb 1-A [Brachyhypopomus gauderio]|uniref:mitochondrial ubiquitin ligase activator of nfkb 1-A n=1 Tax=Brachyhypopomus gauderio TaxID=698409 RepID=UPI0040422BA7